MYTLPEFLKHSSNHEKQIIILMIPNGEGWHNLAVKKLSAILLCQNMTIFFCFKNKLELHGKVSENKDFCSVMMPSEYIKIRVFNQYRYYDQTSFTIYANLESLIKK